MVQILTNLKEKGIDITIQLQPVTIGDVVVVGYAVKGRISVMPSNVTCIKTFDKIDTAIRKALKIAVFKIFPNPAIKGGNIHLEVKQAGEYQVQLLNNKSHLITVENISIDSNKSIANFLVPSNIAAGIYYLRLINEQTKKVYTEKLLVQ